MTRTTSIAQEKTQIKFAEEAAEYFTKHPEHSSYGDLVPGSFIALRWGLGDDCVLVLKLDEYFQNVNYQQAVTKGEGNHEEDQDISGMV